MLYTRETLEGDIVTNIEVLEEMDASELHARRLNVKEVLTPMEGEKFAFSIEDGTVNTPGGDRRLRRNKKFFEENQADFLLHPHIKMTQHVVMMKRKMTSGRSQENSFIVITLNPESNCTCREKNHFLFRWSTSTLPKTTHTSLDVLLE